MGGSILILYLIHSCKIPLGFYTWIMPTLPISNVQLNHEWGSKEKIHDHLIIEILVGTISRTNTPYNLTCWMKTQDWVLCLLHRSNQTYSVSWSLKWNSCTSINSTNNRVLPNSAIAHLILAHVAQNLTQVEDNWDTQPFLNTWNGW